MKTQFIVEYYPSNLVPSDFDNEKYDDNLRDYIKEFKCSSRLIAEAMARILLKWDHFNNINIFKEVDGQSVEECDWNGVGEFQWNLIEAEVEENSLVCA